VWYEGVEWLSIEVNGLNAKEMEARFQVTNEQIETWAAECELGIYPGKSSGKIINGRSFLSGEELKPVTFKETKQKIAAIDRKAASLGQSRSDYLRHLVDKDLSYQEAQESR
jgi:hypothetical protein